MALYLENRKADAVQAKAVQKERDYAKIATDGADIASTAQRMRDRSF